MTASLSRATSTDNAVAYQDESDSSQFWYRPKHVDVVLGDTLGDFGVTYWGVGRKFLSEDSDTGSIRSLVGAVVSGRARIDVTGAQRDELVQQIRNDFPRVSNPRIAPLDITNVRVQPVLATETLQLGTNADIVFPSRIDLGTDFDFLIGTGKGLFAVFAASHSMEDQLPVNPAFAVNVVGTAEFVGDPWKVEISADLRRVWREVRQRYGGSVRYGWFKLGSAQYSDLVQSLVSSNTIRTRFIEGSMDTEQFGRQILEMGKEILSAINEQANAGDGYFKFEPTGPNANTREAVRGFLGSFGWSCSVNASYSSERFTQDISFNRTIEYTGRVRRDISASMALAVRCTNSTRRYFNDLGQPSEPCVTQEKVDAMNERLERELQSPRRQRLLDEIFLMYVSGQITEQQWLNGQKYLWQTSFEEDARLAPPTVRTRNGDLALGDHVLVIGDVSDTASAIIRDGTLRGQVIYDPTVGGDVAKG